MAASLKRVRGVDFYAPAGAVDEASDGLKRHAAEASKLTSEKGKLSRTCHKLWIRAELQSRNPRGSERHKLVSDGRSPLSPDDCKSLIEEDFVIVVEKSDMRSFKDKAFEAAGCTLAEPGSWRHACADYAILGLRDFMHADVGKVPSVPLLRHRHMMFAHAYKGQQGWEASLERYTKGGGELYDYEYIINSHGHRVTSFGGPAGYIGAAVGLLAWCRQVLSAPTVGVDVPKDFVSKLDSDKEASLVKHLQALLRLAVTFAGKAPSVVVIGASGRCGKGAVSFCEELGIDTHKWHRKDTRHGPLKGLLDHEIVINAIRSDTTLKAPFLTHESLRSSSRLLSVLVDLSCDVEAPSNPFPVYSQTTTFANPSVRIIDAPNTPFDVIAIPNLSSLLPRESSRIFSGQLREVLLKLKREGWSSPVWQRCAAAFRKATKALVARPLASLEYASVLSYKPAGASSLDASLRVTEYQRAVMRSLDQAARFQVYQVSGCVLDERRMITSVAALLQRHSILRSAFTISESKEETSAESGNVVAVSVLADPFATNRDKYVSFVKLEKSAASLQAAVQAARAQTLDLSTAVAVRFTIARQPSTDGEFFICILAHAAVADEESIDLLVAELLTCFHSGVYSLPPPELQFQDFACWRNFNVRRATAYLSEQAYQRSELPPTSDGPSELRAQTGMPSLVANSLQFWKSVYDGSAPVLQMPTDFSRTVGTSGSSSVRRKLLNSKLSSLLVEQLSPTSKTLSFFATIMSVFGVILHRRTGENDLLVGSRFHGRVLASLVSSVGPFAEQVGVRFHVEGKESLSLLVEHVREKACESFHHQRHGFLGTQSSTSSSVESTELWQVEVVLDSGLLQRDLSGESDATTAPIPSGFHVAKWKPESVASRMDMSLRVRLVGSLLELQLAYKPNLFSQSSIDETLDQLELMLQCAVHDANKGIMAVSLVTSKSRPGLPNPQVALDHGWPGPITDCFDRCAVATPSAVATCFVNEKVTYKALQVLTNRLANSLINAGLKPGDVVGLYGHRSPAVVWAVMGILKAGAAYSMMDPKYPGSRIVTCLGVAKVKGFLQIEDAGGLAPDVTSYLKGLGKRLLFWKRLPSTRDATESLGLASTEESKGDLGHFQYLSLAAPSKPSVVIGKDDVAVVTFTSGSTGTPKGVMGRHVSLTHFYPWMATRFQLSNRDRFSMCSGIAHDPLQRDIFTPLFFGCPIYVPTDEDIAEPGRLAKWMASQGITATCLTPAMGQLLVSMVSSSKGSAKHAQLLKLRWAFFVGDCLIKKDVSRLRSIAPNVSVINMYGSTETQRAVGYMEIEPKPSHSAFDIPGKSPPMKLLKEVVPVGVGMKDVQLLVINSAGILAGVGELAELYVRSPHIAKGYLGLDKVTADKFLPNPFMPEEKREAYDRMYRTGDLGRYVTHAGRVECCGRADDQIKIRGFRIELGEINAILSKEKLVKETVTIVREDSPGAKCIVAYVVQMPSAEDLSSEQVVATLKNNLKTRVPGYMIPKHIVLLQSMPLTPNGKINRKALPAPAVRAVRKSVRPLTPTEDTLHHLWCSVLNVASVDTADNFFDLGGHSLAATQLTLEMRKALGLEVPLNFIFRYQSLESLATAVDAMKKGDDEKTRDVDLEMESQLPAKLEAAIRACSVQGPKPIKAIFLTGATGFLGAFLVSDCLSRTNAQVMCAVRANSLELGLERIRHNLEAHMLWNDDFEGRIVAVLCDLAKPLLGMKEEAFDDLAGKIDCVIHNGAWVHWLLGYQKLKATNVLGTQAVVQLASRRGLKPLHYVSTTSVYDTERHQSQEVVMEADDLDGGHAGLSGGYPQSKWVAERLLIKARRAGLPVFIYRPGYVTGDSRYGLWNTDDFLCRLIKGCIQLGLAPFPEYSKEAAVGAPTIDMSPVDYVASSIVHCVVQASTGTVPPRNFNVVNPKPFPYISLFQRLRDFGFDIKSVEYPVWRQRLLKEVEGGGLAKNALAPILSHFQEGWISGLRNPRYDMQDLQAVLDTSKSTICCPDMHGLIFTYVSYLIRCEFLENPQTRNSHLLKQVDWDKITRGAQKVARLSRTNRS